MRTANNAISTGISYSGLGAYEFVGHKESTYKTSEEIDKTQIYRCKTCNRVFQFPLLHNGKVDYYEDHIGIRAIKGYECPECAPEKKRRKYKTNKGDIINGWEVISDAILYHRKDGTVGMRSYDCKCIYCGKKRRLLSYKIRQVKCKCGRYQDE